MYTNYVISMNISSVTANIYLMCITLLPAVLQFLIYTHSSTLRTNRYFTGPKSLKQRQTQPIHKALNLLTLWLDPKLEAPIDTNEMDINPSKWSNQPIEYCDVQNNIAVFILIFYSVFFNRETKCSHKQRMLN